MTLPEPDGYQRIYVSGPMTGLPEFNFPAFDQLAAELDERGWHVLNPADKKIVEGWDWQDYLRHDVAWIAESADAIYMLPGWENSRGARLEHHVAKELGLEVFYG